MAQKAISGRGGHCQLFAAGVIYLWREELHANMAQAKLKDYFTSKKRTDSPQAAKRRKIEINCKDTEHGRSRIKRGDDGKAGLFMSDSQPRLEVGGDAPVLATAGVPQEKRLGFVSSVSSTVSTRTKGSLPHVAVRRSSRGKNDRRSKCSTSAGSRGKKSGPRSGAGQVRLTDLLVKSSPSFSSSSSNIDDDSESRSSVSGTGATVEDWQLDVTVEKTVVAEEVTSVWDNHGQLEGHTPRKRIITAEEIVSEGSHLPRRKITVCKQNPGHLHGMAESESAKKRLVLSPSIVTAGPSQVAPFVFLSCLSCPR